VKLVADEFVAVAVTEYDPLAAEPAEVTVSVAEPLAPGARESDAGERDFVHPEGTASVRVNEDVEQAELSAFVTERVNATAVPAATPLLCEGVSDTTGLARVQGAETT
jgi:hypothetical protein